MEKTYPSCSSTLSQETSTDSTSSVPNSPQTMSPSELSFPNTPQCCSLTAERKASSCFASPTLKPPEPPLKMSSSSCPCTPTRKPYRGSHRVSPTESLSVTWIPRQALSSCTPPSSHDIPSNQNSPQKDIPSETTQSDSKYFSPSLQHSRFGESPVKKQRREK